VERNVEKNKKQKKGGSRGMDLWALVFLILAPISAYSLLKPEKSGIFGEAFSNLLSLMFGGARFLIPIIFAWFFVLSVISSLRKRSRLDFLWTILVLLPASALLSGLKSVFKMSVVGGWFGDQVYPLLYNLFGNTLSFVLCFLIFIFALIRLFRVPVIKLIKKIIASKFSADKSLAPKIIDQKTKEKEKQKETKKEKKPKEKEQEPDIFGGDIFAPEPNIVAPLIYDNGKPQPVLVPKALPINSEGIGYMLPPLDLLAQDKKIDYGQNRKELLERAKLLKTTLADFDIKAEVLDIIFGPVVTRYDLTLAPGTKIQTLTNISDNISLSMRARSIRIVPIAEKGAIGIEAPNPKSAIVGLRGILESDQFQKSASKLSLALGKTTGGDAYVATLDSMPHLLIAGATGSGKSVGIHSIILSILYKARPDEVKFLLIDPKRVEMPVYSDIPHLYNPCVEASRAEIITNPQVAANALKKMISVMNDRYDKYAKCLVRNITDYNAKMQQEGKPKDYYIVVVIDELADLMLSSQKEIEDSIQRLAQMARAVGIHLILATQRPSVDIITGSIKANFPARISFQTTSQTDSKVILDMTGAEDLIGRGDMLFLPPGESRPIRLQGAYVSPQEVEHIIAFIDKQNFPKVYEPLETEVEAKESGFKADASKQLLPVLRLIKERGRISQDLLKANFGGSAKASNLLSLLETQGFIAKPEGTNKWQINWPKLEQFLADSKEIKNNVET
ncbi:MAG: DNA translocase FtsK 4TM domain-containing protein, partial [Elusimicrobiota bacterium]|jgi:S-DNA-T family DNA segregation ATPase FtsK/SpoIIIE|nr:DNA translocase FtsK 4TM domain-containing protein [Elusimicrobiota bacterium]